MKAIGNRGHNFLPGHGANNVDRVWTWAKKKKKKQWQCKGVNLLHRHFQKI